MLDLQSKYFTWREVLFSEIATRRGIDNTPDDETQAVIVNTAQHLDRVREALGHPILVSSWFRCLKLNAAVGSKSTSQHVKGEAVDFTSPGAGENDAVFAFLRERMQDLNIDQLIREFPDHPNGGWIHVSFSSLPRFMALLIDDKGTRAA
jgi:hypothetical protein